MSEVSDELLDVGHERSRLPRRLAFLTSRRVQLGAGAIALAAAVALVALPRPDSSATRSSNGRSAPVPSAFATLAAQASYPGRLTDYVRAFSGPGKCTVGNTPNPPQVSIMAALRGFAPRFGLLDVGRTFDEFAGLCSVQVRARDRAGTTVVINIASPVTPPAPPFTSDLLREASRDDGAVRAEYVQLVEAVGWSVTIGATGPASDQLFFDDMERLARDPSLLW